MFKNIDIFDENQEEELFISIENNENFNSTFDFLESNETTLVDIVSKGEDNNLTLEKLKQIFLNVRNQVENIISIKNKNIFPQMLQNKISEILNEIENILQSIFEILTDSKNAFDFIDYGKEKLSENDFKLILQDIENDLNNIYNKTNRIQNLLEYINDNINTLN